ncbi:SDR family NAD(P)-dependent oxidoreductase [Mycobacterium sp.]|uniref:SDR family NAD(P)-dependent oxidoreductase n=1 Tax=Mycobacterium sp. TaxID=1785 RepID=UPI003D0ABEDE
MDKVWFITGASKGFGREFATAALERGDRVAGTARDVTALEDLARRFGRRLLALPLDIRDRAADFDAVTRAHREFGQLDVIVNNAGYGHFGAFEELTEADLRDQFETNLFGSVWITQAALPIMRTQGSGHIVQMSSMAGILAFPNLSAYEGSKWALEAMSEGLAAEVARFGIRVTIVEPGPFGTDWNDRSARKSDKMAEYDPMRSADEEKREGASWGDPKAAAHALLKLVDAAKPPLRQLFGADTLGYISFMYEKRLQGWKDGNHLAQLAQG